jgi:hypothetical protein
MTVAFVITTSTRNLIGHSAYSSMHVVAMLNC